MAHHHSTGFRCGICDEVFAFKEELKLHKKNHVSFSCIDCSKIFKKEIYLITHRATAHRGSRGFICPICDTLFSRKYNMETHMTGHIEDNVCKICCSSFITETGLNKHLTKHSHEELQRVNTLTAYVHCSYCTDREVSFVSKLALHRHEQSSHIGIETFSCTTCRKMFKSKAILDTHVRQKHSTVKWSCEICFNEFATESSLKGHYRIHSNDRPFPCTLCDKIFRHSSNLQQHLYVHKNQRQYKCLYCSMTFFRSNTLQEHQRIHKNVRPYVCKFCKKEFRQGNVLQKHVQAMHLSCDKCGTVVGKKTNLLVHIWNKCQSPN